MFLSYLYTYLAYICFLRSPLAATFLRSLTDFLQHLFIYFYFFYPSIKSFPFYFLLLLLRVYNLYIFFFHSLSTVSCKCCPSANKIYFVCLLPLPNLFFIICASPTVHTKANNHHLLAVSTDSCLLPPPAPCPVPPPATQPRICFNNFLTLEWQLNVFEAIFSFLF